MEQLARHLFAVFLTLGGFGLLALGILDSSFLFMPLGNDLLMVALAARKPTLMPYYAVMASAGSTIGVLLVDVVFRKGGYEALTRRLPARRLEYVRKKVARSAGWALAVACIMPPPFPFTPFVAASAAMGYPRKRILGITGGMRLVRFGVEGLLAIRFGTRILALADSPVVQGTVIALFVIAVAGSTLSIVRWAGRSRRAEQPA